MKVKKAKSKTKISIDPGVSGSGYVVWSGNWKILEAGIISENRVKEWHLKGRSIATGLWKVVRQYKCKEVFIEMPGFFQSQGGQVTARSGALVKLCWFVGFCCGVLIGCKVELIPVRDWKGQMPKDVVIRRIDKIYPNNNFKSHVYDSVGIGLYKQGRF